MSEPRRVVITGIGAVTPIGLGVEGLWAGLHGGRSAVRCITRFDPSVFKSRIAGEVDGFVATDHIEERRARRLDRYSQFTIAATRMALADAELDLARDPRLEDRGIEAGDAADRRAVPVKPGPQSLHAETDRGDGPDSGDHHSAGLRHGPPPPRAGYPRGCATRFPG